MGAIDQPALLQRHRLTVEDYHRMAEAGVLAPDARVELIEGEVVDMAPIGTRHGGALKRVIQAFRTVLPEQTLLSVQDPLRLGDLSEPEPDLMVLKARSDFYASAHPTADDVLLVVEISDSSARYDREIKVPLYARHGVPEVWVVDLDARVLRVHRRPARGEYTEITTLAEPERLTLLALPALTVDLSGLLGIA